jgi:hypothetical protein
MGATSVSCEQLNSWSTSRFYRSMLFTRPDIEPRSWSCPAAFSGRQIHHARYEAQAVRKSAREPQLGLRQPQVEVLATPGWYQFFSIFGREGSPGSTRLFGRNPEQFAGQWFRPFF